ncbi:PH domain-containing protein [Chloroflexota bacterium]
MLIHEEPAEYNSWFKLLFLIPIGLFIGAALFALNQESEASVALVADGVFFVLLFFFIMPRKYQIYHDRLKIVQGSPFAINIPLTTIKEVKHGSGINALVYFGVRFVTSTKYVIEIVRNKGLNYVISPQNGDIFREQLNQAIESEAHNQYYSKK